MDLKQMYNENADFHRYVDSAMRINFADKTLDEFLSLNITKETAKYYADNKQKRRETYV